MADRPPFFACYPLDFLNDPLVEVMSTLQVGAYWILLCKAWQFDPPASLPNDDQILARLARVDAEVWRDIKHGVLAPFRLGSDGRYHSKRLRQEYDTALRLIRSRKAGGQKTAQKRWGKGDTETCDSSAIAQLPAQQQLTCSPATEIEIKTQKKEPRKEPPLPPAAVEPGGGSEIIRPPRFDEVQTAWNGIDGVSPAIEVSSTHRTLFGARCMNPLFCQRWRDGIEAVRRSERCKGTSGWRATFKWFLKDGTLEELLNGDYEPVQAVPAPRSARKAGVDAVIAAAQAELAQEPQ